MRIETASIGRLYSELWRHAIGMRRALVLGFVFLVSSQVLKLVVPALSGRAINAIQSDGAVGFGQAGAMLMAVFGATVLSWMLHGPGRILERNVALRVRRSVSDDLLARLFSAPLSWHERQHGSETAHRVQQTTRALYDFGQSQFIYLQSATRLFGPIIALLVLSPPVGLAAVLGYGVLAAIIVSFDRKMQQLAHHENDAERRYWAGLSDVLNSIQAIFSLRMRSGAMRLVGDRLQAVFAPLRRTILFNEAKWATVDILTQLVWMGLAVLYVWLQVRGVQAGGADLAIHAAAGQGVDAMSGIAGAAAGDAAMGATAGAHGPGHPVRIGNLFMVYEYALQAGGVITSIASNFQQLTRQQADFTAASPIMDAPRAVVVQPQSEESAWAEIARAQPSQRAGALGSDARAALGWRTLGISDWRYRHARDAQRPSIDGLELQLARGRRYALIGPSGSGKSTLLRLLAGLYAAQDGALRISRADGAGTDRQLQGEAARQAMAGIATLVPQDAELFQGTVRENLEMARNAPLPAAGTPTAVAAGAASGTGASRVAKAAPGTVAERASDAELDSALAIAQARSFVDAMPGGLDAVLGARGGNLSGGQRQRLALARGLIAARESSLLLLDEPTSALDPVTEHALVRDLFSQLPESTTVVASIHRPQLLELFDEVIIVNAGRLAAQGTVASLLGNSEELAAFQRTPA